MLETRIWSLGREDLLEKGMETHQYSCLRNPWTEVPRGPQPMGWQRARHDWVTNTFFLHLLQDFVNNSCSNKLLLCSWFEMFSSVHSVVSDSLQPHGLQHTRLPCPSPTPGACSNSCPVSGWCYPTISSSVIPFSSCLQSFPASGYFSMSQFSAHLKYTRIFFLKQISTRFLFYCATIFCFILHIHINYSIFKYEKNKHDEYITAWIHWFIKKKK